MPCSARYRSWRLPLVLVAAGWLAPSTCPAQAPPSGELSSGALPGGTSEAPATLLSPLPHQDDTLCPPAPDAPQGPPLSAVHPDDAPSPSGSRPPLGSLASSSGISLGLGGAGGGAVGGPGLAYNPVVGQLPVVSSYHFADYLNSSVRDQNAHLGYFQQNLTLLTPLWQCPTDEFSARVSVGVDSFNTNAILPDSRQRFPAELWNVSLGSTYRHLFDNGWIGGGGVSVGSPSDRPFNNLNVMSVAVNGFLRVPQGEHNAWIFSVNLSSNSQVLRYIPIPGVAYLYVPSQQFQALVGFPFAHVNWSPNPQWSVFVSYALLTNVRARVTFRATRQVRLFTAFDLVNQNYYLADRLDPNQRFFSYSDRVYSGVQFLLNRRAFFNLSGGYVFDRRFFESTTGLSGATDMVHVAPGAFVGGAFQIRF